MAVNSFSSCSKAIICLAVFQVNNDAPCYLFQRVYGLNQVVLTPLCLQILYQVPGVESGEISVVVLYKHYQLSVCRR
jgi:hypothetical protein